jgi:protein-disulfide isomerase
MRLLMPSSFSAQRAENRFFLPMTNRLRRYSLGSLIGLTVLLMAGCSLPARQTADAGSDSVAAPAASAPAEEVNPEAAAPAADDAPIAEESAEGSYNGMQVGFTAEGYPYRGAPDAPVTLYEYSDFQCPFCARHFVQTEPVLNENHVRAGQVKVVFRDFPIVELHPNAPAAHIASQCVAEQGAVQFWGMHDRLFESQGEWGGSPDPASIFARLAEESGADMTAFSDCLLTGNKDIYVNAAIAEGRAAGVSGTPSFLVANNATLQESLLVGAQPYESFVAAITAIEAGNAPAAEAGSGGDAGIPVWASAEGLRPDPARPGFTVAGDPYRGNPDAKVVVVEFSDFQCPYCQRHVTETGPVLNERFVETGQVFWVFKHFPLTIHPQAPAAGAAAECAGDQGQFWEMHDLLFANSGEWSINDPDPVFAAYAAQLGLDVDAFGACLTDLDAARRVDADITDGAQFVQGTPTFIMLFNGEGRIIPGALPTERFVTIVEEVLAQVP